MIEQLTIASYNVQCLGKDITGKRKRKEIKDFFLNTKPNTAAPYKTVKTKQRK
jgi:hypothetical protein